MQCCDWTNEKYYCILICAWCKFTHFEYGPPTTSIQTHVDSIIECHHYWISCQRAIQQNALCRTVLGLYRRRMSHVWTRRHWPWKELRGRSGATRKTTCIGRTRPVHSAGIAGRYGRHTLHPIRPDRPTTNLSASRLSNRKSSRAAPPGDRLRKTIYSVI